MFLFLLFHLEKIYILIIFVLYLFEINEILITLKESINNGNWTLFDKLENLIWTIAHNIWSTRAKKYIKEKKWKHL